MFPRPSVHRVYVPRVYELLFSVLMLCKMYCTIQWHNLAHSFGSVPWFFPPSFMFAPQIGQNCKCAGTTVCLFECLYESWTFSKLHGAFGPVSCQLANSVINYQQLSSASKNRDLGWLTPNFSLKDGCVSQTVEDFHLSHICPCPVWISFAKSKLMCFGLSDWCEHGSCE